MDMDRKGLNMALFSYQTPITSLWKTEPAVDEVCTLCQLSCAPVVSNLYLLSGYAPPELVTSICPTCVRLASESGLSLSDISSVKPLPKKKKL